MRDYELEAKAKEMLEGKKKEEEKKEPKKLEGLEAYLERDKKSILDRAREELLGIYQYDWKPLGDIVAWMQGPESVTKDIDVPEPKTHGATAPPLNLTKLFGKAVNWTRDVMPLKLVNKEGGVTKVIDYANDFIDIPVRNAQGEILKKTIDTPGIVRAADLGKPVTKRVNPASKHFEQDYFKHRDPRKTDGWDKLTDEEKEILLDSKRNEAAVEGIGLAQKFRGGNLGGVSFDVQDIKTRGGAYSYGPRAEEHEAIHNTITELDKLYPGASMLVEDKVEALLKKEGIKKDLDNILLRAYKPKQISQERLSWLNNLTANRYDMDVLPVKEFVEKKAKENPGIPLKEIYKFETGQYRQNNPFIGVSIEDSQRLREGGKRVYREVVEWLNGLTPKELDAQITKFLKRKYADKSVASKVAADKKP